MKPGDRVNYPSMRRPGERAVGVITSLQGTCDRCDVPLWAVRTDELPGWPLALCETVLGPEDGAPKGS